MLVVAFKYELIVQYELFITLILSNKIQFLAKFPQCATPVILKVNLMTSSVRHSGEGVKFYVLNIPAALTVSYLASFWNLPIFTQAASDPDLSDKSVFTTLIRMGAPFIRLGPAIGEIFRYFDWHQFVMLTWRREGKMLISIPMAKNEKASPFLLRGAGLL